MAVTAISDPTNGSSSDVPVITPRPLSISLSRSQSLRNSRLFRSKSQKRQSISGLSPSRSASTHRRTYSNASLSSSVSDKLTSLPQSNNKSKRNSLVSISSPILVQESSSFSQPARKAPCPNLPARVSLAPPTPVISASFPSPPRKMNPPSQPKSGLTRFPSSSRASIDSVSTGVSSNNESVASSNPRNFTPAQQQHQHSGSHSTTSSRHPSQTNINQSTQTLAHMSLSNLPPMSDVWLDDDDEEDVPEAKMSSIMKKWHGRKESQSAISSLSKTVSISSSVTSAPSFNANIHSKGPNPALSFTNLRRLAGRKTNSVDSNISLAPQKQSSSPGKSTSPSSYHQHSTSISSSLSIGLGNQTTSSKNSRFKKLFSSPSAHPVTKDMISQPSNFVHTGHLDPFTLQGMKRAVVPRPGQNPGRTSATSANSTAYSARNPDTHWRENSSSSTWSNLSSFAQTANASTPATSASSSPSLGSDQQFAANGKFNTNFNHSTITVVGTPEHRPVIKQGSRDSFAWSATPNVDFAEQQRWLLHHVPETESSVSSPKEHSSQYLHLKLAAASVSSFHSTHAGNNAPDAERKASMLLPSPIINGSNESSSKSLDQTASHRQAYVCADNKGQNWGGSALGIMVEGSEPKWV